MKSQQQFHVVIADGNYIAIVVGCSEIKLYNELPSYSEINYANRQIKCKYK